MDNSGFKGIVPQQLISDIKDGKCILFVGSGVSAQIQRSNKKYLPTWNGLLNEMLEWANENRVSFWNGTDDIQEMIKKNNLIMAAQELEDVIGLDNLGDFYKRVFRDKNVKPSNVHKIIPYIPFRAVITTNYDTLIEGSYAFVNEGAIPPVFTQLDLNDKNSFLRNKDFFIFKMHGHIDRPNSIILGKKGYDRIIFTDPVYRQFLETLFSVYTVLFVGFGGDDNDVNEILDKLSILYSRTMDKHYLLAPDGKYNITEKRRFINDRRLEIIEYFKDTNHSQVEEFLKELRAQVSGSADEIPKKNHTRQRVFLSYSWSDVDIINNYIEPFLSENGIEVWRSDHELKAGDILYREISKAIEESTIMIALITEKSLNSQWVKAELEVGILKQINDRSIKVIPIVIGDVQIPNYLNQVYYIKLNRDFSQENLKPILLALKANDNK